MPLNVKHINKVLAFIREDLKRLNMPSWGITKNSLAGERILGYQPNFFPECGTVACFAGWSKLLTIPQEKWKEQFNSDGWLDSSSLEEAARLGLTKEEQSLFAEVHGTKEKQLQEVERRLCHIVKNRVAAGEESAREIDI